MFCIERKGSYHNCQGAAQFTWSPDKFNLLAFGTKLLLESLIAEPQHPEEKWPAICTSQDSDPTVQFNTCCLAFEKQDEHLPR